jgi:hypothetical protein
MPPPSSSRAGRSNTDPTPEQLFEEAARADASEEIRLHVFSHDQSGFNAEVLKTTEVLASDFADSARQYARTASTRLLVAYSAGRSPSQHEASILTVADVPNLLNVLNVLEGSGDLPLFTPTSESAERIVFYVVSLRDASSVWLHFFRRKSGRTFRLSRSRRIAALFTDQLFDRLDSEPMIFDSTFDALASRPHVVMTNQRNFETALDFLELARRDTDATLRTITAAVPIKNRDVFLAAASSDINMLAKVRSIAEKIRRNPNYAKAMTLDRLQKFAKAHAGAHLDLEGPPGNEELVFHSDVQRRWRILKLLDDDYLHSDLTSVDYEVNSKEMLAP